MALLRAAAGLLALAATRASAQSGNAASYYQTNNQQMTSFQQCFCWNAATNTYCDGSSSLWNSSACNTWATNNLWWIALAALAMVAAVAFPFVFYMARCCCRCCGGRHPTRGACCSAVESRATFPGYKNSTIVGVKVFFLVALLVSVGVSVRNFKDNSHLRTSVAAAATAFDGAIVSTADTWASATGAATWLTSKDCPLSTTVTDSGLAATVAAASGTYAGYVGDIRDRIKNVRDFWHSFESVTKGIVIFGLTLFGCGLLLAAFNARCLVGVVMVAFCAHLFCLLALTILVAPAHVLVHEACDNLEGTMVPLATAAMSSAQACGVSGIDSTVNTVNSNLNTYATTSASSFCKDYKEACNALGTSCAQTTCADAASYANGATQTGLYNFFDGGNANVDIVDGLLAQFVALANADSPLAQMHPNAHQAAVRLVKFGAQTLPALRTMNRVVALNQGCGGIANIVTSTLGPAVCFGADNLNVRLHRVTIELVVLVHVAVATIAALVLGMKRFRALNSYNAERAELEPLAGPSVVVAHVYRASAINESEGVVVVTTVGCPSVDDASSACCGASSYGTAECGANYRAI